MSFYDKHKLHNYFIQATPHLQDIIGIKFFDEKMGQAACMTWGKVYKEDKILELVKVKCAQYGFRNIESIEVCYSLQEITIYPFFYEQWIYFIHEHIPYKDGYKKWLLKKQEVLLHGQDIKFVGCLKRY